MTISKSLLLGLLTAGAMGLSTLGSVPTSVTTSGTAAQPAAAMATPLYQHPGKILAGNCFQCHGTNGKNGPWESLAGESAAELYNELKELQTSNEADEAIMKVHAQGYTDAQLRLIADFFSQVR